MNQQNTCDAILVLPPAVDRVARIYPAPHFLSCFLNATGFATKTADLNMAVLMALAKLEPGKQQDYAIQQPRDLINMELSGIRFTHVFRDAYMNMFGALYQTEDLSLDNILALANDREMKMMADLIQPDLIQEIVSARPFIVGFSIPFAQQLIPSVALAQRLKELMDRVEIWFGGPIVTLLPKSLRDAMPGRLPVDALIQYEGEYPLATRLATIKAGGVPGAAPPRLSPRQLFDFNRFEPAALTHIPKTASIPVRHSSGCYWQKCTFCDYINLHRDKVYRPRTVDRIMADIRNYLQMGFHNFRMLCEAIPPAHAMAIAKAILKETPGIKWHSFIRVDKGFTPEIFKTLKQSGFTCTVGMESASDKILGVLNKGYNQAVLSTFMDNMATADFGDNHLNIMVGNPGETYEDARHTLEFCARYKKLIKWFKPSRFTLTATSYMSQHPEQFGIQIHKTHGHHGTDRSGGRLTSLAFDDPNGMNDTEIKAILKGYESLNHL